MGNVQILLRQHVGAPCAAIVQAGDEVKKGTKIATPTGLGALSDPTKSRRKSLYRSKWKMRMISLPW